MRLISTCTIVGALSCQFLFAQSNLTLVDTGYESAPRFVVAPGQVITLFLTGAETVLAGRVRASDTAPWPSSIGGFSALIQQGNLTFRVPVFAVEQRNRCTTGKNSPSCFVTALTAQIPFEILLSIPIGGPPRGINIVTTLVVTENGKDSAAFLLSPDFTNPHILRTCDVLFDGSVLQSNSCNPVVAHADGTLASAEHPARVGEAVFIYATGLGTTSPAVDSGIPTFQPPPAIKNSLSVFLDYSPPEATLPNASPSLNTGIELAELAPGYVGLYALKVRIQAPTGAISRCSGGGTNAALTLTGLAGLSSQATSLSDTVRICVGASAP